VKTLARALELVQASKGSRSKVYLSSESTYTDAILLEEQFSSALVVDGGFQQGKGIWKRTCEQRAVLASPTFYGVRIDNAQSIGIQIAHLEIRSADLDVATTVPKEEVSSYGIFARGNASLSLLDVKVAAGKGRTGATGASGDPAVQPSCPEMPICADGGTGGNGKDGLPGAPGSFLNKGFLAGDGGIGLDGEPGKNGTPGQPSKAFPGCTSGCSGCPANGGCKADENAVLYVKPSSCGCGGLGGKAGKPGRGGGASVGVFLGGNVTFSAVLSDLSAGNGGDGGDGGDASEGGPGTPGKRGDAVPNDGKPVNQEGTAVCHKGGCFMTGSDNNCGCYYQDTKPENPSAPLLIQPNPPGGTGGKGGKGGKGGGGSGGWSIALVHPQGKKPTLDASTTLSKGAPGKGKSGAPDGIADVLFAH
jgi:hypothetical protein